MERRGLLVAHTSRPAGCTPLCRTRASTATRPDALLRRDQPRGPATTSGPRSRDNYLAATASRPSGWTPASRSSCPSYAGEPPLLRRARPRGRQPLPARARPRLLRGPAARAARTRSCCLCRSAWAGSQRYGAAAVVRRHRRPPSRRCAAQIPAGPQHRACPGSRGGPPTSAGSTSGDPTTPAYRELIVRWFQFGAFCPLFRLHGIREPGHAVGSDQTGAANEVWSFGEEAYGIIREPAAPAGAAAPVRHGADARRRTRDRAAADARRCSWSSRTRRRRGRSTTSSCSARTCWSRR